MKILNIQTDKIIEMTNKEKEKYDKENSNKYGIKLMYPRKVVKLKEPIYIVGMSAKELQLVSFYLELENRKPIVNIELDTKLKKEKL